MSWCSENPHRTMGSSTEAECYGLYEVARENIWQRQLQQELQLYEISPTVVYEDNKSSIALIEKDGVAHKRVKHYGVNWSFVKDCVRLHEMGVEYLPTEQQPADFLTKTLTHAKFQEHRDRVMGDERLQKHFGASA